MPTKCVSICFRSKDAKSASLNVPVLRCKGTKSSVVQWLGGEQVLSLCVYAKGSRLCHCRGHEVLLFCFSVSG